MQAGMNITARARSVGAVIGSAVFPPSRTRGADLWVGGLSAGDVTFTGTLQPI